MQASHLTAPDWFAIITDLIYAGVTMRELSSVMDVQMSASLIRAYRGGTQPTYARGEALVSYWCKRLGKERHAVPRLPYVDPQKRRVWRR